jgi:hypothetical protein
VKVCEKVPLLKKPESHTSGPIDVSLVAVWSSWKLQITASPGATVTVAGENVMPGPTWTV